MTKSKTSNQTNTNVWVLIIDKRSGTAVTVHRTRSSAKQYLFQYCVDKLDEQYVKTLDGVDQVIEAFFEESCRALEWEWYLLDECKIQ